MQRTRMYDRSVKRLVRLGATIADIATMEQAVSSQPEAGALIRGGGGVRKMRFGYGGVGKRGGGRTIYYVATAAETIYLIAAYAKVDQDNVTANDLKLYRAIIEGETHGR